MTFWEKMLITAPVNGAGSLLGFAAPLLPSGLAYLSHIDDANAPGVPFTPEHIGGFQYQQDGKWQRAEWDGSRWVPKPGDYASDDDKVLLDASRKKLLDLTDAGRAAIQEAIQEALPLTYLVPSICRDTHDLFLQSRNWRQPIDPLMLDLDGDWGSLQVWRDLDQDGIADAGELSSLDALGISRIGVVGSLTNGTGGTQAGTTVNGNLIAQSASFTREVDGVQVNRTVGAIDLESNPFYREFTTAVPLTEQAKALLRMQGR
ncbi:hypothetical protein [Variovorax sp. WDL1]|nr:hypothetical protein [Variovorax sp. WDL1]